MKLGLVRLMTVLFGVGACTPAAEAPGCGGAADASERRCAIREGLPDPGCTPGAVMTTDLGVVCHQSTRSRRHVDPAVHRWVYSEYGFAFPQPPGRFEVDHLVPLELGGANGVENLWPQPASPTPGFHEKDLVENYLHDEVCFGRMPLEQAQRAIARDWIGVWRAMPPTAKRVSP
jgi:hypothetical protein